MIGLAVIAGIINAAVRKRNKAHVKALIQSAYKQENTEMQGRMADKEERAPDYKVIVRQKMEKRKKSRVASIS